MRGRGGACPFRRPGRACDRWLQWPVKRSRKRCRSARCQGIFRETLTSSGGSGGGIFSSCKQRLQLHAASSILLSRKSKRSEFMTSEAQMKSIAIAFTTLLLATPTTAADKYQIIPRSSNLDQVSQEFVYAAFVVNQITGAISNCKGTFNFKVPQVTDISCSPGNILQGAMPSGAVEYSPTENAFTGPPALWKIDQTNGQLTFCTTSSNLPQWWCAAIPAPN
jgi:hypothetical protein